MSFKLENYTYNTFKEKAIEDLEVSSNFNTLKLNNVLNKSLAKWREALLKTE